MRQLLRFASRYGFRVRQAFGFALLLSALSGAAVAGLHTPEIDVGSMGSGVAVLSCGILILNGRRSRK